MAQRLNINPTRQELLKLKKQLATATRGHKLLKEKRDGLMQQFLGIIREAQTLRERIEQELSRAFKSFIFASADMRPEVMAAALGFPSRTTQLSVTTKNVMNVETPEFHFEESGEMLCYSLALTSSELDTALATFSETLRDMVKLAGIEHSAKLLAAEIEKTRRRVNALEHRLIPSIQETIKYISIKLNEQERGTIISLMKVKETITQE